MQALTRNSGATANETSQRCLVRQKVIEQLSFEEAHLDRLPERLRYHSKAMYYLKNKMCPWKNHCKPKHIRARIMESSEVFCTLSEKLGDKFAQPCTRHGKAHSCLHPFRDNPSIVRNWRTFWQSLPSSQRREALIAMFKHNLDQHLGQGGRPDDWQMGSFQVLGWRGNDDAGMCRQAFMLVTGVGGYSLDKARQAALNGKCTSPGRSELQLSLDIGAHPRPQLFLDAIVWLTSFAEEYGDRRHHRRHRHHHHHRHQHHRHHHHHHQQQQQQQQEQQQHHHHHHYHHHHHQQQQQQQQHHYHHPVRRTCALGTAVPQS